MKKSELKEIIREEIQKALNEPAEKEYTFGYVFFADEDEEDYGEVTVTASNEKEARDLAYKAARRENSAVKTSSPEKMSLEKVK